LHVVDISHKNFEEQIGVVKNTLQDIGAFDKPILTIFNKMDLYEANTFDKWLSNDTKEELLSDLKEKWQRETHGNAVFIAAIEKRNIEELRNAILNKVREMYKVRYPYKTEFLY
jgi:GTP-binding protein HflX